MAIKSPRAQVARDRSRIRRVVHRLAFLPPIAPLNPVEYTPRLVAYLVLLLALSLTLFLTTPLTPFTPWPLLAGGIAIFTMAVCTIRSLGGADSAWSVGILVHLGLVFIAGPSGALVAAVGEETGKNLRLRNGWFRLLFNTSNIYMSNMAAWFVFDNITHLSKSSFALSAAAGLLAGAAHFFINYLLLAIVVRVSNPDSPSIPAYILQSLSILAYNVSYGCGAALFVLAYQTAGLFGVLVMLTLVVPLQASFIVIGRRTYERDAAVVRRSNVIARTQHELRTPIQAILGLVEIMEHKLGTSPDETLRGIAKEIKGATAQMDSITDNGIEYDRLITSNLTLTPTPVNAQKAITTVVASVQELAEPPIAPITINVPADITLLADEKRFTRAMGELLKNAIKFTPADGTITVDAQRTTDTTCTIRVVDTGIGIAEDALPHIFEPLSQEDDSKTRRYGGMGMGLAIVDRTCALHGGSVSVESTPGNGSCFTLTWPTTAESPRVSPSGSGEFLIRKA